MLRFGHSFDVQDLGGNIMSYKKFLGAASAALMIVIVFTLALAPAAGAASKYKVLYKFAHPANGANPQGNLIFDAAGNLYGTTYIGGARNMGTVFKLAPNQDGSWTESVLHSFNGSDGDEPFAGLIFDAAGNLYGTTHSGGASDLGTVFKLAPNQDGSWTESVLHSFSGKDGDSLDAGLIFDRAGNLYGTTLLGGASDFGTVFKLAPNQDGSWTESVLHSFSGSHDGSHPAAGLIFDAAGNLYGTTDSGGKLNLCEGDRSGCGVVFKLTPNADGSWTESVLHSFGVNHYGMYPQASLIFDAAGNLYGTTVRGGHVGFFGRLRCGVVFKLAPNQDGSWTESVLHYFGTSAALPYYGLIFDAAGNLYGTTVAGSANSGAAFKLSPNQDGSWAYSLLHVFQGGPGLNPEGGLVLGSAGTLYGTTFYCTSGCNGVVYQITP
jgi:uncharacterized repeat protein (TIGR03803 family)